VFLDNCTSLDETKPNSQYQAGLLFPTLPTDRSAVATIAEIPLRLAEPST
jgi:hypothetical protein